MAALIWEKPAAALYHTQGYQRKRVLDSD